MILGIRPTVDFAFKKIFGSPENVRALIGLLNAILKLPNPIEKVEILNPFNYQDFAESKPIVLDIRCRDSNGGWFNVEIQVSTYLGMIQRLVYYACSMYVDQLERGQTYATATSAISICLLGHRVFRETSQAHHRFQMADLPSGRALDRAIEVHTVELTKYNLDEQTIRARSEIEKWAFLLLRAQDCDAATLRELLPGEDFATAIHAIETISAKTEDKLMYDQREKAQRDHEWAMASVREEGIREGIEQGIEQGMTRGLLGGKIQNLQELLEQPVTPERELRAMDETTLRGMLTSLQQNLRDR